MNRLAWIITGIAFLATTGFTQRTLDRVVAQVNNEVILQSELEQQQQLLREQLSQELQGAELDEAVAAAGRDALRDLIDRSLLRQKADEFGIRTDVEVLRTMEQMRQDYNFDTIEDLESAIAAQGTPVEFFKDNIRSQYVTQQVIQREVYSKIIITTEEIRSYYDEHMADFDRPAGIRIQEIVFSIDGLTPEAIEEVRVKAQEARDRIQSGEEFAAVASEVSESPSRANGGDLGFFAAGTLRADYEKVASVLRRGALSEVLELPGEFVILRLQDRHDGGIMSFELARTEIETILFSERLDPEIRKYLTSLREQGFVAVRDGFADTGAPDG